MRIGSVVEMGDTTKVYNRCPMCQRENEVIVKTEEFQAWREHGEMIQNAMPGLDKEQREILISGTCPECWKLLFASDEEGQDGE